MFINSTKLENITDILMTITIFFYIMSKKWIDV